MTTGTSRDDTHTTIRMIQPQIARPVAMSAGFRASMFSVKLAIQATYAMPRVIEEMARIVAIFA